MMARTAVRTDNWAVDVASRFKGAQFPVDEQEARRRMEGLTIRGKDASEVLDQMEFPVDTPAILLHRISQSLG